MMIFIFNKINNMIKNEIVIFSMNVQPAVMLPYNKHILSDLPHVIYYCDST